MNPRIEEIMNSCVFTKQLLPPTQEEIFTAFAEQVALDCLEIAKETLSFAAYVQLADKVYEHFGISYE